jgi:heme/copper-type cytochrome/quinol oxidase subunit 3
MKYILWHIIGHGLIIVISISIMILAIRLNETSSKKVFMGTGIFIAIEAIFVIGHALEFYPSLESNILLQGASILSIFLIMFGIKEGIK